MIVNHDKCNKAARVYLTPQSPESTKAGQTAKAWLDTLPDRFYRDGMAEVIKYGCDGRQALRHREK